MSEFSDFTIADRPAVSLQIYQYLKQAIISCKLEPGRAISEKEIASSMDVSRQPVREAFIQLAKCSLVRVYPQRGTYVTQISIKSVLDGQLIRSSIECALMERLTALISAEQLENLTYLLSQQQHAIDTQNYQLFLHQDDAFHQQFALIADCPLAWETIETVKAVMDRVRYLDLTRESTMEQVLSEHRAIIDALANRDVHQAKILLKQHLSDFPQVIKSIQERYPTWFAEQ
ncbi:GntR family transcriptional regulator [Celerinatantimonas diazotrophica]|uniref:GntR family transcriptional regulator n=1 Tax=Celerinatantimonas diazotrophica TaxID=412034 RepID=A0A4R1KF27_9GAMM|nr:GntR family transcriptional regulator [Celerinatantimonas diazotrophica]TCK62720.1 GntR family transcriptional regulator [Celerinatantimonas diazotrophica]CAG9298350.1 HTH-type transcriptional repressor RspR [Celerinatantimonas diazotrophica]